jgi:hypothetical protein
MRRTLLVSIVHTVVTTAALILPAVVLGEDCDLVIVAGQSNAVGYDAPASRLKAEPADAQIMFWWRCGDPPPDEHDSTSGGQWTHLQAQPRGNPLPKSGRQYGNFHDPSGGFGPEIGLARRLHAAGGPPLAVVKVAFSGTGFVSKDWNPGNPCYDSLVNEVKTAVATARRKGIMTKVRALVWVQGEGDARAAAAYAPALTAMIAALRKELPAPQMIALVGVNTRFGNGGPAMAAVVQAQKSVAKTTLRVRYVDTTGASIANTAHFDAEGTLEVGKRFADALLAFERQLPSER